MTPRIIAVEVREVNGTTLVGGGLAGEEKIDNSVSSMLNMTYPADMHVEISAIQLKTHSGLKLRL